MRSLLFGAFGDRFDDHDFDHCLGGTHVLLEEGDRVIGHASVVPRTLYVGIETFACGYVEAVAVLPAEQGRGLGGALMAEVDRIIRAEYAIGGLSTGASAFYERLGWRRWSGPSFVVSHGEWLRTPEEDDGVMVLAVQEGLDDRERIAVDERAGDSW